MRKALATVTLPALFVLALAADAHARAPGRSHVHFDARTHQTAYAGPGREEAPPANVKEVLIGYFGPTAAEHPRGGDMWCAARLAIEKENEAGGYKGLPFRLVTAWSENPWGSGVKQVTSMVYKQEVWAIIGGIDGPSTHLAEQVVTKARLSLLSPASTDKTVNLANVPWMFSLLPGDHLLAPPLADAIEAHIADKSFLILSATDHDSHLLTVELTKSLAQRRLVPLNHFEFSPTEKDLTELAAAIARTEIGTLMVIADAEPSARIVSAVRQMGFAGRIFGGPRMGQRTFVEKARQAAEGVVFPLLYLRSQNSQGFEKEFSARFRHDPDYLAAHTYDAVRLLIAAIRKAGLNRVLIQDAIRKLSPWTGVTGPITWGTLGGNSRAVRLGTVRAGHVTSAPEPHGPGEATCRYPRQ